STPGRRVPGSAGAWSAPGRVRVTDFGLVRALGDVSGGAQARAPGLLTDATPAAPDPGDLEAPMTREGSLLGTPGYMAPEQYLGKEVDARSDQFSFCAALYEGLYGRRAHAGGDLAKIRAATLEGRVGEAPAGAAVPLHVRRALLRGLRPARE